MMDVERYIDFPTNGDELAALVGEGNTDSDHRNPLALDALGWLRMAWYEVFLQMSDEDLRRTAFPTELHTGICPLFLLQEVARHCRLEYPRGARRLASPMGNVAAIAIEATAAWAQELFPRTGKIYLELLANLAKPLVVNGVPSLRLEYIGTCLANGYEDDRLHHDAEVAALEALGATELILPQSVVDALPIRLVERYDRYIDAHELHTTERNLDPFAIEARLRAEGRWPLAPAEVQAIVAAATPSTSTSLRAPFPARLLHVKQLALSVASELQRAGRPAMAAEIRERLEDQAGVCWQDLLSLLASRVRLHLADPLPSPVF